MFRKEFRFFSLPFMKIYATNLKFHVPNHDRIYFVQISEKCTGSPPLNAKSIDDESTWIYDQLTSGIIPFYGTTDLGKSISRDDIRNFLELHHVQMFDVSILIHFDALLFIYLIFILWDDHSLLVFRFPLLLCIGKRSV